MDTVNIYGLWPDLVYCVWAVGRLFTALVARRLRGHLVLRGRDSGKILADGSLSLYGSVW